LIRRCPNGATPIDEVYRPEREETQGTETSKYLEEKKITNDSASSGERTRSSPNHVASVTWGCRTDII